MPVQMGIYSAYQLGIHDHSTDALGGRIFWEERIIGANITTPATLNAATQSDTVIVLTLMKQITILEDSPGTMTVYFNVWRGVNVGNVESAVYLNDVIVGGSWTENPGLSPGVQHSRVVGADLVAGDRIQIYGRIVTSNEVFVADQYLEYSYGILRLSDRTMNPILGTDYALPVPQTNDF